MTGLIRDGILAAFFIAVAAVVLAPIISMADDEPTPGPVTSSPNDCMFAADGSKPAC